MYLPVIRLCINPWQWVSGRKVNACRVPQLFTICPGPIRQKRLLLLFLESNSIQVTICHLEWCQGRMGSKRFDSFRSKLTGCHRVSGLFKIQVTYSVYDTILYCRSCRSLILYLLEVVRHPFDLHRDGCPVLILLERQIQLCLLWSREGDGGTASNTGSVRPVPRPRVLAIRIVHSTISVPANSIHIDDCNQSVLNSRGCMQGGLAFEPPYVPL